MKQETAAAAVTDAAPKKESRLARFLMGSFLVRILMRLTNFCYGKILSSAVGVWFTQYKNEIAHADDSRIVRFFRRLDPGGKIFRPMKFKIAQVLEGSLFLSAANRFAMWLLSLPVYHYGIFFFVYGVASMAVHVGFMMLRSALILTNMGLLITGTSILISLPLLGSSHSLGSAIAASPLCDLIVFRFIGARREPFETAGHSHAKPILPILLGLLLGAGCVAVPPLLYVAGIAGVIALYTILKIPEFGVVITFFCMPFLPTMALVALVGLITVAFVFKVICGKRTLKLEKVDAPVLVLMILYFLGGFFSMKTKLSLQPMLVIVCFMLAYFLVVNLIRNKAWLQRCLGASVCSVVLVSLYGIYQHFFSSTLAAWLDKDMFEDISGRVVSTLENPNVLGEYLIMAVPFFLVFFFTRKGFSQKTLSLIPLGIVLVCILYTWSRGAWLGLALGVFLFLLIYNRKSLCCMFFALFGIPALPYVLPATIWQRIASIGNIGDSSTGYRVYIWKGTIKMLGDYLFTGIGTGVNVFPYVYQKYSYAGIEAAPHSHNLFLQITTELGIFGLAAFLVLIVLFCRQCFTAVSTSQNRNTRLLTAAGLCGTVAVLLQGMTDYIWYNYRMILWFWLILGLTCAVIRIGKRDASENAETYLSEQI